MIADDYKFVISENVEPVQSLPDKNSIVSSNRDNSHDKHGDGAAIPSFVTKVTTKSD